MLADAPVADAPCAGRPAETSLQSVPTASLIHRARSISEPAVSQGGARMRWALWLRAAVRSWAVRAGRTTRKRLSPRGGPALSFERLEDRTLLAVLTVNTVADNETADAFLTLSEALAVIEDGNLADGVSLLGNRMLTAGEAAQVNLTQALGTNDTVQFAASTNGTEFDLILGEFSIVKDVEIQGNGASQTIIDAQLNSRIFNVSGVGTDLTLEGLTLKNGRVTGDGGAIYSSATGTSAITITNSTLSGNSTTGDFNQGGAVAARYGAVNVLNSTLSGNSTAGYQCDGGAVYAYSGAVTVTNSTFSGNSTTGFESDGAAILAHQGAVTITNSTFSGNFTLGDEADGGAIHHRYGTVLIQGSTFTGNSTAGTNAFGGALSSSRNGNITVVNSTFSGNQVNGTGPVGGGAIYFDDGDVTIINSTITNNSAPIGGGIGIYADNAGESLTIINSIIAGNTATTNPDFTAPGTPGTNLIVRNSLIGRNDGTTLTATGVVTPDANGNFIGGGAGAGLTAAQIGLGALADNGGPTQTHALLAGSLALNRGDSTRATLTGLPGGTPLTSDQRGNPFFRIFGSAVDMGAFEAQALRTIIGDLATFDGTAGNDVVNVNLAASTVTINGLSYLLPVEVKGIDLFDAGGAGDTLTILGTTGADLADWSAATRSGFLDSTGAATGATSFGWLNFETITYVGAGNNDTVTLADSAGNDQFTGNGGGGQSFLAGPGYRFTALATRTVVATAANGGFDRAFLNGTSGNDIFTASAASAKFNTVDVTANGFEAMQGNAMGGTNDQAVLNGSTGRETFTGLALQNQGILSPFGSTNALIAAGFDQVTADGAAHPPGQGDSARLVGRVGIVDTLTFSDGTVSLAGTGYLFSVDQFENVVGTGQGSSGNDQAIFIGLASAADTFTVAAATPHIGTLTNVLGSFSVESIARVNLIRSTGPADRLIRRATPQFTLTATGGWTNVA